MKLKQSPCLEKKQWEAKQKWNEVDFLVLLAGLFLFVS